MQEYQHKCKQELIAGFVMITKCFESYQFEEYKLESFIFQKPPGRALMGCWLSSSKPLGLWNQFWI